MIVALGSSRAFDPTLSRWHTCFGGWAAHGVLRLRLRLLTRGLPTPAELARLEKRYGPDSPAVPFVQNHLSQLYFCVGRYQEAVEASKVVQKCWVRRLARAFHLGCDVLLWCCGAAPMPCGQRYR